MKILNVTQGSPEWLAARTKHLCASDAPAMMGDSKYVSRGELLRMKATGDERELDSFTQDRFRLGHETEAKARPLVEEMLGEELYPVTASDDAGRLLASFDGITMGGDVGFEHKLWNEDLAAAVRAGEVPASHYWQLEQQLLIGGLERIVFVCSDGTKKKFVHTEYRAVPGRAAQLLAGWEQFEKDVAAYQHVEIPHAPNGREIKDLPALSIELIGSVQSSNLAAYRAQALDFIRDIKTDLSTDQDFADADKTVKFCERAESQIEAVKKAALAKTASIDELFRTLDQLREEMRTKRLNLTKQVETRKAARRAEILRDGHVALTSHINDLNRRLEGSYMPVIPADFAGVMKGKKTIASLLDAVNTELARAKIAANAMADQIDANLKVLRAVPEEYRLGLFNDLNFIVQKAPGDFEAVVKVRIAEHKERERLRLEAERERIRQEEQAKLAAAGQPAAAAPAIATTAKPAPLPANVTTLWAMAKPTDDEIINVVANYFRVPTGKAVEWLRAVDLTAAARRHAEEPVTT